MIFRYKFMAYNPDVDNLLAKDRTDNLLLGTKSLEE